MGKQKPKSGEIKRNEKKLFVLFFGSLLILLPLVYLPQALDKALMPRLFALSGILFFTGFALFSAKKPSKVYDFSVWRQWLFIVMAGFLLTGLFASFFAFNTREVWFDLVRTTLFVGGTAFAALIMLRTENWPDKLTKIALLAAIPALLIGGIQYIDRVLLSELTVLPDRRALEYAVTGLMAHKNIYSVFLMLLLPFSAFGIYRFRGKWQMAAVAVSFFNMLMIILLKTRSAWVGVAAGIIVVVILLALFSRKIHFSLAWRNRVVAIVILGILTLIPLAWAGSNADPFSLPGRVYSIFDPQSPHNIHRLSAWETSIHMIRDHPLTGTGPGNWRIILPFYFHDMDVEVEALNWARPHNDFLWIMSERGVLGLLLYLGIFALGFSYAVRIIRSQNKNVQAAHKIFALFMAGGLAAYLADSFFSFPYERLEIQVLLMIMLAGLVVMIHPLKPKPSTVISRRTGLLISMVIFGMGLVYSYNATTMEISAKKALTALSAENWEEALHWSKEASTRVRSLENNGYPVEYFQGLAYSGMGRNREAAAAFRKAKEQSPKNVWVLDRLGVTLFRMGETDEAEALLLEVREIIPGLAGTNTNLANIYFSRGEYRKAHEILTSITNWENNPEIRNNVRILEQMMDEQQTD